MGTFEQRQGLGVTPTDCGCGAGDIRNQGQDGVAGCTSICPAKIRTRDVRVPADDVGASSGCDSRELSRVAANVEDRAGAPHAKDSIDECLFLCPLCFSVVVRSVVSGPSRITVFGSESMQTFAASPQIALQHRGCDFRSLLQCGG